jgi:hypothetical protein
MQEGVRRRGAERSDSEKEKRDLLHGTVATIPVFQNAVMVGAPVTVKASTRL